MVHVFVMLGDEALKVEGVSAGSGRLRAEAIPAQGDGSINADEDEKGSRRKNIKYLLTPD